MNYKNLLAIGLASVSTILSANAVTTFTNAQLLGAANGDLNDPNNWDNGLTSTGGQGYTTADGQLTANYNTGDERFNVRSVISTGSNKFSTGSPLIIGAGPSGSFTVNSGGELEMAGTYARVEIDNGSLIFEDGSILDMRKSVDVANGLLHIGSDVTTGQNGIQNFLSVGSGGTLKFDVDGSFANHTIVGNNMGSLTLDAASTLSLAFSAAPTTGATFDLISGVTTFSGTFGTVSATGLGAGQSLIALYGNGNDQLLQVQVVPEPASAALLGLGALALILRRQK